MTTIIEVKDVTRTFGSGPTATAALRGVSLTVGEGQLVALRGRSGSGKTTLLNIVGGLDRPDSGTVRVDGKDVTAMSERERVRLRRETVTYIFQSFGLLPVLSAAENVGVPLRISGVAPRAREERVATDARARRPGRPLPAPARRALRRPAAAGGHRPRPRRPGRGCCSPTSPRASLDAETGKQIMRLLRSVVRSEGVTALLATHDPTLMDIADSVLHLADGTVEEKS